MQMGAAADAAVAATVVDGNLTHTHAQTRCVVTLVF